MSATDEATPHTFSVMLLVAVVATCVSHVITRIYAYTKSVFATRVIATSVSHVKVLLLAEC